MESSDPECEFWESDGPSASAGYDIMRIVRPPQTQGSASRADVGSPRRMFLRSTSEKAVGTRQIPRPPVPASARPVRFVNPTRAAGSTAPFSSSALLARVRSLPSSSENTEELETDSEYDILDVEASLIDTESEGSPPPTRGASFAFSDVPSRNASMTSLGSSASIDSRTGRKRTLDYNDNWTPPVPTSARKVARTTQRGRPKTPPPQPTERAQTARPPDSVHNLIETPTISRVCKSFSDFVGLESNGEAEPSTSTRQAQVPMAVDLSGLCIIAHSVDAQRKFDRIPLSWGVQYELARGVGNGWWTWDQVNTADLTALKGPSHNAASKVAQVVLGSTGLMFITDPAVWAELDCEEQAIIEGRGRGLGLQGDFMDRTNWYGGKIQQIARLEVADDGSFRLALCRMESRKSHRFARFLGSRRMLQISIQRLLVNNRGDDLRAFFKQKFVLCGRIFVAFGAKDNKVFLMETPEDYERTMRVPGDESRISLDDFVAWHNPLELNSQQPTSKWATRFDLGFSISVPVLEFSEERMFRMADSYAPHDPSQGKAPTDSIYTDGCGWMNGAALSAIARHMGYEDRPTAVQGRIGGYKGLWVLHPRDQALEPKIWLRESQWKICHPANGTGHRIFDLLQPPRVTLPSRLSRLTILNLAHNGVSHDTFTVLMEETLKAEVQPLMQWVGPKAMLLLWRAVERVGGVAMKRVMQHALGTSRAMGLMGRILEDGVDGDSEALEDALNGMVEGVERGKLLAEDLAVTALRDPVTGVPLTKHAAVLDLIQAGFQPHKCPSLYDKLKLIVTEVIENIIQDFHITVPLSAEAFIIPDPYGILEEGQIHFRSSKRLKEGHDDPNPYILEGDVLARHYLSRLVYRNPNRLPWDVQKVTAVKCELLAQYIDVIVFPVKGRRSLASVLAGGDYDGDVCVCIYDPRLVTSFQNSPFEEQPKDFLEENFEDKGTIQRVSDMAAELAQHTNDHEFGRQKLQDCLLTGLTMAPIGPYSMYHENSAYSSGYDAKKTIRLARMFNIVLDSRKTGHIVKKKVFSLDKRTHDRVRPDCLRSTREGEQQQQTGLLPLKPKEGQGRFILDTLFAKGMMMRDEYLKAYDDLPVKCRASSGNWRNGPDEELLQVVRGAEHLKSHDAFRDDWNLLDKHIQDHIEVWRAVCREEAKNKGRNTPSRRGRGRGGAPGANSSKARRTQWDDLARSFAAGPALPPDSALGALPGLELLKASAAYAAHQRFAWSVAFGALCRLKAAARAPVAFAGEFAEVMAIPASAGRVLEQSRLALYAGAAMAVSAAGAASAAR